MEKSTFGSKFNQIIPFVQSRSTIPVTDTSADQLTTKRTAEVKRTKVENQKCVKRLNADQQVWDLVVSRLKTVDRHAVADRKSIFASEIKNVPKFQAAALFVKLAKWMPVEMAVHLATPGNGKKFWKALEQEWPNLSIKQGKIKADLAVLLRLVQALLKDYEGDAVYALVLACPKDQGVEILKRIMPDYDSALAATSWFFKHGCSALPSLLIEACPQWKKELVRSVIKNVPSRDLKACLALQQLGEAMLKAGDAATAKKMAVQCKKILVDASGQFYPGRERWSIAIPVATLIVKLGSRELLGDLIDELYHCKDEFALEILNDPALFRPDPGHMGCIRDLMYDYLGRPDKLDPTKFVRCLNLAADLTGTLSGVPDLGAEKSSLVKILFALAFKGCNLLVAYGNEIKVKIDPESTLSPVKLGSRMFAEIYTKAFPKATDEQRGYACILFEALCTTGPGQNTENILEYLGIKSHWDYKPEILPKEVQQAFVEVVQEGHWVPPVKVLL